MEILLRAEESSDLGEASDGGMGDVDVLRAAGMANQDRDHDLAFSLWRLTILHERRTLAGVVLDLVELGQRIGVADAELAVVLVLGWMFDPTCVPCKGRGLLPMGVEHVLSDDVCPACGGSGHRPTGFDDGAKALYAKIQDLQSYAAGAVARKLRG